MSYQLTAHTSRLRRIRPRGDDRRRSSVRSGRPVAELAEGITAPTEHSVVRGNTTAVSATHGNLLEREAGQRHRRCTRVHALECAGQVVTQLIVVVVPPTVRVTGSVQAADMRHHRERPVYRGNRGKRQLAVHVQWMERLDHVRLLAQLTGVVGA